MHMTKNALNNESPNGYSFWSYCVALVVVFALADASFGGLLKQYLTFIKVEYAFAAFAMIATLGVFARDGSPGGRHIRDYAFHKL